MKIRSITYFFNPGWPLRETPLQKAKEFTSEARSAFEGAGFEVQTTRLATVPFSELIPQVDVDTLTRFAQALEQAARTSGLEYVSLGPALPARLADYASIPQVLAATENVFLTGLMTVPHKGISLPAVRACAEVIERIAPISSDGFANLRFAALANVPPGAPFFPAAYHQGDQPSFALAIQAAELAVEAFGGALSLADARQCLTSSVEENGRSLNNIAVELSRQFGVPFGGIDFSLAPFPETAHSTGTAIERLGVPAAGLHGSLAAAAILADTLDQASFPRAGFNGLFMPVLEDATLAARAAEGKLGVKDLLLYSAVCGTGIDTVPLPGDATAEQMTAVLLDLAALSQRLEKPLTARLMPIPGRQAGDLTGFNFAFFANSRVLAIDSEPLRGLFGGQETFPLARRK